MWQNYFLNNLKNCFKLYEPIITCKYALLALCLFVSVGKRSTRTKTKRGTSSSEQACLNRKQMIARNKIKKKNLFAFLLQFVLRFWRLTAPTLLLNGEPASVDTTNQLCRRQLRACTLLSTSASFLLFVCQRICWFTSERNFDWRLADYRTRSELRELSRNVLTRCGTTSGMAAKESDYCWVSCGWHRVIH